MMVVTSIRMGWTDILKDVYVDRTVMEMGWVINYVATIILVEVKLLHK